MTEPKKVKATLITKIAIKKELGDLNRLYLPTILTKSDFKDGQEVKVTIESI